MIMTQSSGINPRNIKPIIRNNMDNKISLRFSAIDPVYEKSIPEPVEKEYSGKDFISYGVDNAYPQFLYDLVNDCATLSSIINGIVDYVKGNGTKSSIMTDEEAEDFIEKTATDYLTFGAFYWQIIRSMTGKIQKVVWLDARFVRTDRDNNLFWYSEEFGKKYGRTGKAIVYPRYTEERIDPESVICVKAPLSRGVYGNPIWSGAIKDAVIQTKIEDFHLNELSNNFMGSAVISFNNGVPTDEEKKEIEKNVAEKFGGAENSARFLLLFNDSKDNATTVERLSSDDFDERYESLAKRSREQIFIAFRATPSLFGLATADNAFNSEEYEQSFRLFNKTVVRPIQVKITSALAKLFGADVMTIDPFNLNESETNIQ